MCGVHRHDTGRASCALELVVSMTAAHVHDTSDVERCVACMSGRATGLTPGSPPRSRDARAELTRAPPTGYRPRTDVRHLSLYLPGMTDPGD